MSKYVITKKNTFDVENEVYFAESLQEALGFQARNVALDHDTEWLIAVVVD